MLADSVNLPKTFAAWRSGSAQAHINEVLEVELNRQAFEILGGYNSDNELVEILDFSVEDDLLRARIVINFEEVIPSGCPDAPRREDRRVERVLHMDTNTDQAVLDEDDSDPDTWALWDRNSAADGK